jgi:hypothetical protein
VKKGEIDKDAKAGQYHNEAAIIPESEFAWVAFKVSTARSIGLVRGCLLRFYNAVLLPCPHATELILPKPLFEWNGADSHYCKSIVVCTDLCERIDTTI